MVEKGLFNNFHGLPYIISNLTMWTITTLKGFRIGPSMPEITMVWKLTLGLKHPVGWNSVRLSLLSMKNMYRARLKGFGQVV